MTTKAEFVPLKKQSVLQNVDAKNQFSNLYLNQSHKCFNFSILQSNNKSFSKSKYFDSQFVNDENCLWNKSSSSNTLHPKPFKFISAFDEAEATVKTKRWKNDSFDVTTTRSSTLSLHIAAYENSVEGGDTVSKDKNENMKKNLNKGQKQLINSALNPFEFPRQQTEDESEPAVTQFTASQQLLNPNQLGSSNDNQQGTQNAASVGPALVHFNQRPPPPSAQIFGTVMIEFFAIFSKGGLLLWYFSEGKDLFKGTINEFIANVLLLERTVATYNHDGMTVKYKLDNELDLVVLMIYQSIIKLSYADHLLSEVQLRFRDMYKNSIEEGRFFTAGPKVFNGFNGEFQKILGEVKTVSKTSQEPVKPRTYDESAKSKKTVKSMIETAADRQAKAAEKVKADQKAAAEKTTTPQTSPPNSPYSGQSEEDEEVLKNLEKLKNRGKKPAKKEEPKKPAPSKKGKEGRKWELGGKASDAAVLDYSVGSPPDAKNNAETEEDKKFFEQNRHMIGKSGGELAGIDENEEVLLEDEEEYDDQNGEIPEQPTQQAKGWFSAFKSLVGNKQLTAQDIEPVMDKMKETLTSKNVASEPAEKICESVGAKLEGKVISSFSRIATIVKDAMRESLVQLLTPKRRVDILRDIKQAKSEKRPYVIVFCGVNGVGKSTNLAKITFWLNENGNRVLIAAGDTFRAGAVEQLRTHTRHLNALHSNSVQLYEQGYGKDPAGLAAAAIEIAREREIDVVLVDTAGRMQDNEPLMRALSKLIRTNSPDLVLFVGEALVGNEAVDQLVKFNQALADHSDRDAVPRLIDGIVLTKFDTIDDKVGAAVSMTYITGQPIVFVGTGQTYADLKSLNVNAVVNSLLK